MNLRDLMELCRVSNLPTVWSNCVVGVCAGGYLYAQTSDGRFPVEKAVEAAPMIAIAMSLIYSGGMVMNDWVDREIDARERPHRPIPSGRVRPRTARDFAIVSMAVGVLLVLLTANMTILHTTPRHDTHLWSGLAACMLVGLAVLYNFTHQRSSYSIVFMALSRAMVILCGALILAPSNRNPAPQAASLVVAGPAMTLFLYTLAISAVARREVDHAAKPRRLRGPKTVMNMIAAMPLLDAIWLVVMGLWPASLFCVACAGLTKLGHRKVAGS